MPVTAHQLATLSVLFTLFSGVACSAAGGAAPGSGGTASGTGCPQENLTRACSCGTSGGRQVCLGGAWSPCDCLDATGSTGGAGAGGGSGTGGTGASPGAVPLTFPGNQRADITFAWQSSAQPVTDGSCPPGEYEGNFQGLYYSVLAPGGLPVPVTNVDLPGQPSGFHFLLSPAQGGEITQAVKGEINGLADQLFPFKADILGQLNCRTGAFTGTLTNGTYSILVSGLLPQSFEGILSGHYDKRTHTFVSGVWDVKETTATPPGTLAPTLPRDFKRDGFGGSGEFSAALATDLNDPNVKKGCPTNYTCGPGLFGPNKFLCNTTLGTPTCLSDADCAPQFPGENVPCLKASLFSLCMRECKP
jgi:hypothetical protein